MAIAIVALRLLELSGFGVSPESVGIHRAEPGASRATQAASPKGSDRGSEQIKGPINRRVELYREPGWASFFFHQVQPAKAFVDTAITTARHVRFLFQVKDCRSRWRLSRPGAVGIGIGDSLHHGNSGETFPNLLVNKLGLLVDDLTGKTIDRHVDPIMFFPLDREFFEISFAGCVFSVLSNDIN